MTTLLIRLYPARWRARYAVEFLALLEERPLGPFDVADILLGALDAHLHLRGLGAASQNGRGFAMSYRIGGWAAIIGGLLWLIGLAASSVDQSDEAWPWLGFLLAGTALLLVALAGLSAFQSRRFPWLVWTAFLVPAVGTIVSVVGLAAMALIGDRTLVSNVSPWEVWMVGMLALIGGSGLFAIATWLTSSLSRAGSLLLGVTAAVLLASVLGSVAVEPVGEQIGFALFSLGILGFGGGWILVGVSAVRAGHKASAPTAGAPA